MFIERKPPRIPTGLRPAVKAQVKSILAQNPHLWTEEQMPAIIRLATLRVRHLDMEDQIEREGFTIENVAGNQVTHPLLPGATSTANAASSLERSLGILFVAQNSGVIKGHEERAAKQKQPKQRANGRAPRLRLA